MVRGPPSALQRQHRAFMSKALNNAPKDLAQKDKMKWAAAAWSRQRGGKVVKARRKEKKGKGIGSALLKALPVVLKIAKGAAQIGSKIAAPHNKQASDILGAIGGLGVKRKRKTKGKGLWDKLQVMPKGAITTIGKKYQPTNCFETASQRRQKADALR